MLDARVAVAGAFDPTRQQSSLRPLTINSSSSEALMTALVDDLHQWPWGGTLQHLDRLAAPLAAATRDFQVNCRP